MKISLLAFAIMILLMRIKNTPKYLNKDIFQKQIQDLLDRLNNL